MSSKNYSWWLLFCLVLLCISGVPTFFLGRRVDCVCVNARVLGNTQLMQENLNLDMLTEKNNNNSPAFKDNLSLTVCKKRFWEFPKKQF
uniref:Uncharacterized protein n=1 Tax=Oryzias latipes TaxID=8090 RepID=A0A3P9HTE0_ORYLA